jgi:hypothetical protein
MSDADVKSLIHKLDEALNLLRQHEGNLSVGAIRTRTLIALARSEVAQALSDSCHQQQVGTELFERTSKPPFLEPGIQGAVG